MHFLLIECASHMLVLKLQHKRHHPAYGSRTGRFVKHRIAALYTNYPFPLLLSIGYTIVFLYEFSLHNAFRVNLTDQKEDVYAEIERLVYIANREFFRSKRR